MDHRIPASSNLAQTNLVSILPAILGDPPFLPEDHLAKSILTRRRYLPHLRDEELLQSNRDSAVQALVEQKRKRLVEAGSSSWWLDPAPQWRVEDGEIFVRFFVRIEGGSLSDSLGFVFVWEDDDEKTSSDWHFSEITLPTYSSSGKAVWHPTYDAAVQSALQDEASSDAASVTGSDYWAGVSEQEFERNVHTDVESASIRCGELFAPLLI
jgi:hypothetical protein